MIVGKPCAFRMIRRATHPSASNPEPGWMSQCQHPRCPGHWQTGWATEVGALDAYAKHTCDKRHMALHPRCFTPICPEGTLHARIDMYRGKAPGHEEDEMTEQTTTTETQTAEQPTEAKPTKTKKAGKLVPCFCRTFEVGEDIETNGQPDVTIETTGCDRMTNRTFAQGHDAKLVSFLVRAELDGKDIRYGRDTGLVTTTDAVAACRLVSQELAHKAKVALANGKDKDAKKAERAAAKQAKGAERAAALQAKLDAKKAKDEAKAAEQAATEPTQAPDTGIPQAKTQAKVGRWEYSGTANADGSFTYINGGGQPKTIEAGKWTPIAQDA